MWSEFAEDVGAALLCERAPDVLIDADAEADGDDDDEEDAGHGAVVAGHREELWEEIEEETGEEGERERLPGEQRA